MTETVIISGSANGIGRAIALRHVARGDRVFGFDKQASDDGDGFEQLKVDVSDVEAVEAATEFVWQKTGGVDRVYANAGIAMGGDLMSATPEMFRTCFDVNLVGAWATLKASAARMLNAARPGKLCITGSEHSLGFQHAGAGIYSASKHAVLGLADVLRHELAPSISLSVLCPGLTTTAIADQPGQSDGAAAFAKAMMAEGLDPDIVAREAIAGVERGDFIITTHMATRLGWDRRTSDVNTAFQRVPREGQDVDAFAVPSVVARVRDALSRDN